MSDLFGNKLEQKSKKDNRITTSYPDEIYNFISDIANEQEMSFSEVVLRLVIPTVKKIYKQEELIKKHPQSVAFDLITKSKDK
jgi:hypothetical protein